MSRLTIVTLLLTLAACAGVVLKLAADTLAQKVDALATEQQAASRQIIFETRSNARWVVAVAERVAAQKETNQARRSQRGIDDGH